MKEKAFSLPQDLGDGLILRWATLDDVEEVAAFNVDIHSDNPDEPEEFLTHWTRDLMYGDHPTTNVDDFTVVVDENNGGKIVSTLCVIPQKWLYGGPYNGIEFLCGRPELVGTDPAFRRRGLIRHQIEAIHAKGKVRGELVQAITGIPWYYNQFGYEMALNLSGGRAYHWNRRGNYKPVEKENYHLRSATIDDIPHLNELYQANCAESMIVRKRDKALWLYEMEVANKETGDYREFQIVETADNEIVGYVEYKKWGERFYIRELGVKSGHSWRAVSIFITHALKVKADEINKENEKPVSYLYFGLGEDHSVYEALGTQLEKQVRPYAWYIRVADLPGFLRHITPILLGRLANSVMAGHSGELKLNFYQNQVKLSFENGKLIEIGTYEPEHFEDGDAFFPDSTFLKLLFCYRSMEELSQARADCFARNAGAAVLLNILFPKQSSNVVQLG